MANATSFQVEQKPRKRRLSARQKASSLFHLWHSIQDMKAEAEDMKDGELVLLMGMVELLVEERTAGLSRAHGSALSGADTARPNYGSKQREAGPPEAARLPCLSERGCSAAAWPRCADRQTLPRRAPRHSLWPARGRPRSTAFRAAGRGLAARAPWRTPPEPHPCRV